MATQTTQRRFQARHWIIVVLVGLLLGATQGARTLAEPRPTIRSAGESEPHAIRGRFWRPAGSNARRPDPSAGLRPRPWHPPTVATDLASG